MSFKSCIFFILFLIYVIDPSIISGAKTERYLSRSKRLVNGTEVIPHSWPWHVSLETKGSALKCGGVLLSENWILSAAHCFRFYRLTDDPSNWKAIIGIHNRSNDEDSQQEREISEIQVHNKFNINQKGDDIALVKVKTPFKLASESQIANISSDEMKFHAVTCKLIGLKEILNDNKFVITVLEEIKVPILKHNVCSSLDPDTISDHMLCGIGQTVNGDSGNPLLCQENGRWVVAGLLSWGYEDKPTLSIYTKVSKYQRWIEGYLKNRPLSAYFNELDREKKL